MSKLNIRGQEVEVDSNCIPLVKFFNSIELDTKYCCEGHKMGESFYIMFEDYIDDEKIMNFIKKHSNKYDHTPFCGRFVKWIRKVEGRIKLNWEYLDENKIYSKIDYETIILGYPKQYKI